MSSTERGQVVADTISAGEVDIPTANTAVRITATATKCFGVIVSNINASNAIYVGDSDVDNASARGIRLNAGERVFIPVHDASMLYFVGTANGDDVGYMILK